MKLNALDNAPVTQSPSSDLEIFLDMIVETNKSDPYGREAQKGLISCYGTRSCGFDSYVG